MMSFLVLFVLALMLINIPVEEQTGDIDSNNQIMVTLRWEQNCDVDIHMMLPDGRKVFYNERNQPPAFLDIDVTNWNTYINPNGGFHIIKNNEEIISLRDVVYGEYVINTHLFNMYEESSVKIEVIVYDIEHKSIIYATERVMGRENSQEHIVRFKLVEGNLPSLFSVLEVRDDEPIYFIGGR